jgi:cyclin H
MYYGESSQANKWQLSSQVELNTIREFANRRACNALITTSTSTNTTNNVGDAAMLVEDNGTTSSIKDDNPLPATQCEVYGFDETTRALKDESDPNSSSTTTENAPPLLTASEEATLITFYCSKIPLLIGPHATLARCQRDAKVTSTACLLYRRFYLSNSIMIHNPKSMLAAAAFLATKIEDCMIAIQYIELGTGEMNARVPIADILQAEIRLIRGIDYELLVFSPYRTILSYTEDLRTFLKSERGAGLVTFNSNSSSEERSSQQQVAGEDLRPIHDAAMRICDDVIVSDIPLLFAPGEVGLAALMIANEYCCAAHSTNDNDNSDIAAGDKEEEIGSSNSSSLHIDILGYIRCRFQDTANEITESINVDTDTIETVTQRVSNLGQLIRELKMGKHGCGNYGLDMNELKMLNKKLKKCRAWEDSEVKDEKGKTKKKKKRKAEEGDD